MGVIFKIPAFIVYLVSGLWGLAICLEIVIENLGFIGGTIAFLLAPATLIFAPWYEGLANSTWFPLLLIYGGGIGATILYAIGSAIDGE
jgi:hypothetical protein